MPKRLIPLIITLALLLPGLIAGGWVGYYYTHQKHTVLLPTTPPHAQGAPASHTMRFNRQRATFAPGRPRDRGVGWV